jgi:hypothetical protein
MSSQARQRRGPMPCGQEGCYYPESAGDLRWCVYAGYWRYHCPRPEQPADTAQGPPENAAQGQPENAAPEQPADTAQGQPEDTGPPAPDPSPKQLELLPEAAPGPAAKRRLSRRR